MPVALVWTGWVERAEESAPQGHHYHGAFFQWLRGVAEGVAQKWHGLREKPFSLSPLLRLTPRGPWVWRWTWMVDEASEEHLLQLAFEALGKARFTLGGWTFVPEKLEISGHPWAGRASWESLLQPSSPSRLIQLNWLSPYAIRHGTRDVFLPEPSILFKTYLRSWEVQAPLEIREALIAPDLWFSHLVITRFSLQTRPYLIRDRRHTGTVGWIRLFVPSEVPQEVHHTLQALTRWAFFRGTGRKTTHGMGTTIPGRQRGSRKLWSALENPFGRTPSPG